MKGINDSEDEAERRHRVAESKIMGALIEDIERIRKQSLIHSIITRLTLLYRLIGDFFPTVKAMGKKEGPLTPAPIYTLEQTNSLIRTYNSIIEDIYMNLKKKDSYVNELKKFELEEQEKYSINEAAKTLYIMSMNILQIMGYMLRWKK